MRLAITGATGLVGYPICRHLIAAGHEVTVLGRAGVADADHVPWSLTDGVPDLAGQGALIHAAFSHLPGRYRGGEGADPARFLETNLQGSCCLFEAAAKAGVPVIFLSSRAVYGAYPLGTTLHEALTPKPDTLYGEMKLAAERALGEGGISLRATGVYGPPVPGRPHKWTELFRAFDQGEAPAVRCGTEVHSSDLAEAISLLLDHGLSRLGGTVLNVSDFVLDNRDLLACYAEVTGRDGDLPARANPARVSAMTTDRIAQMGWRPRGPTALTEVLQAITGTDRRKMDPR